ncbi:MAG: ABC transporter ATP-binding protein [Candidatus Thorarchaeota archaeon]
MNNIFVEIKDLAKQYMSYSAIPILALRNLNLDVFENEICSIMGPSGCGKSTLLNMVGGIDYPTSGFLRVGEYYLTSPEMMVRAYTSKTHTDYRRKTIGFIFQFHNLSPIHSAEENIELPMTFAGVTREERKKRSKELLEDINLLNRAKHRPDALSGGERQRVSVAMALANNPKLLLADEPTGELDIANTKDICDLFLKLKEARDFTMILVTHNPQVATIGNRILEMRDGAIKGEIEKSVLENASFIPETKEKGLNEKSVNKFPPNFCYNCGNNMIIRPKLHSRSGIWTESNGEKTEIELDFAQCSSCGEIFWQPNKIGIKTS